MKPEIGYSDIVMGAYIKDLIGNIEWNMTQTSLQDPYFEQLSVEKFTLETLLNEIAKRVGITPTEIVESFVQRTRKCAKDSSDPNCNYVLEVSRDAAMSILDGLYFGYLEGESRGGFEEF